MESLSITLTTYCGSVGETERLEKFFSVTVCPPLTSCTGMLKRVGSSVEGVTVILRLLPHCLPPREPRLEFPAAWDLLGVCADGSCFEERME